MPHLGAVRLAGAAGQLSQLEFQAPILAGVIKIVYWGGDYFFVYLWGFVVLITLFLMTIYPDLIAPLFDKYTPMPEGELKGQVENTK